MKNHRFPWLRNRTTDNRKCEKARNIKEKRTIEMFNTVSNPLVAHHSSANVNCLEQQNAYQTPGTLCFWGFLKIKDRIKQLYFILSLNGIICLCCLHQLQTESVSSKYHSCLDYQFRRASDHLQYYHFYRPVLL